MFLYRITRKVNNDSTISIDNIIYEVPGKYTGFKINIRYDPTNRDKAYIFDDNGNLSETIFQVNKIDNTKVRRTQKRKQSIFHRLIHNSRRNLFMFKTYYGLTIDPFTKETETKHFYKSKEFKEALNRLELKSTKGIGLITGQPGAGKTSLLRYFESTLNSNLYKCVYIPLSTLTVMDFYKALCDGLGVNPDLKGYYV